MPLSRLLFNHFYIGVLITVFYAAVNPVMIGWGYPGLSGLLLAEILVLTPVGIYHMYSVGPWKDVILFREKLPVRKMIIWSLVGIVVIFLVYVPLFPVGLFFRTTVFSWLPEWYFNPGFGSENASLLAKLFLAGILIDGIIAPTVEELFFRGYLLPRMSFLQKWAPVVNGALFGIYHFWQPHNLIALIVIGIILSFIVWKTRNVYLGIIIHCAINVLGAIAGYLAVTSGVDLAR